MQKTDSDITSYPIKKSSFLSFRVLVVPVFFSLMAYIFFQMREAAAIFYGFLLVFIVIVSLIFIVCKMFQRKPGLVLRKEGFSANVGTVAIDLIPWSEMTGSTEMSVLNHNYVNIYLTDPEKYVTTASGYRKLMYKSHLKQQRTMVVLNCNHLGTTPKALLEKMYEYFYKYSENTK